MRILEVIASVDPASGGPVEGLLRVDEAARASGVERHVASCDLPDASFLAGFPLRTFALGEPRVRNRLLRHYGFTPHLIPWLKRHADEYDAIVVNGLWNFASFAAAMVLPRGHTPYYVFTHGMMDPWFRRTYPLKHLAKQLLWTVAEGRLLAGASAVLFTAEEERRLARGQFLGWAYREAVVGYGTTEPPPAAQVQRRAFRAAVGGLRARPYLLYLSRIHPKKGCDLLIEAFARTADRLPDLDLVIAGPDQLGWAEELKEMALRLGIASRIHWPGPLYGDAKWGALREAEAFVLPSHQENFGIVVAEALACGTPVLITDKVNVWREVAEAGAGLVSEDTVDGVAAMLRQWASDRGGLARGQARIAFHRHFDVTETARRLSNLMATAA